HASAEPTAPAAPFARAALPAIVMLLALRPAAVAATAPIADADVWWVAAAGREILATGHVPATNLWSFADAGHPWVMHEWLFAVPYAVLLTRFGPHVFALVAALACVATLAPAFAVLTRARNAVTVGFGALLCTTLFDMRLTSARPPHVALALATATAWLAFRERFTRRDIVAAALLGLLWANAHGSFPIGLGLLVAAAFEGRADRRARVMAIAAFAVATFVNPYGARLHGLVLSYLLGGNGVIRLVHAHVVEFMPVWRAVAAGRLDLARLAGLVLVLALALGAVARPSLRARGVFVLALCAMTLRQYRHLELTGLLGAPLLAPVMDGWLDRTRWRPETGAWIARHVLRGAALVALAAIASHAVAVAVRPAPAWLYENVGGADLPALAREVRPGARIFTTFEHTGVVIWYATPRGGRVLYDVRNDCYTEATAVDAGVLQRPRAPGASPLEVLARRGVDTVLVLATHPLAGILAGEPRWREDARRGAWVRLARGPL
ncbi:MAG: hypothetical protein WCJ30_21630, partial [Deltaproteobacteria bacterium]